MMPHVARGLAGAGLALVAAACGSRDAPRSPAVEASTPAAVPATRPEGFAAITLTPAVGMPPDSAAPVGDFWYHTGDGALEWFLRARRLASHRAYRLELTVDERARYAIASLRTDSAGTLTGHGTLTAFTNKVCVGNDADPPQPLNGAHQFRVAVKEDGSDSRGNGVTSPGGNLPCSGNGDDRWAYVLVQSSLAPLATRRDAP